MAYYLIDYENVMVAGLNGLLSLTENDTVMIFYSENSDKITFGLHHRLNETQATVKYQKVECGTKNALDFQLASFLGYLINSPDTAEDEKYYIVSKDNGFAVLVKYWARKNISVDIVSDLTGQKPQPEAVKKPPEPPPVPKVVAVKVAEPEKASQPDMKDMKKELTKKLSGYISDKNELNAVVQMIEKAKSKQEVNANLGKKYKDNKRTKLIYGIIKPYIKDKK